MVSRYHETLSGCPVAINLSTAEITQHCLLVLCCQAFVGALDVNTEVGIHMFAMSFEQSQLVSFCISTSLVSES